MKYILMCGGHYPQKMPKQLREINGEPIASRTIRLLQEAGVEDIAISTHDHRFEPMGVPLLEHENNFGKGGRWVDGFYPSDDPTCYIFGDVIFSRQAINTIVKTETDDIEFFASTPPFSPLYMKGWAEPFAFKVRNQDHFRESIQLVRDFAEQGLFNREPIAWELWQVIKKTPLNVIDYTNYTAINDFTCDCDSEKEYNEFIKRMWGRQI
jgi:hypothetical protein